MSGSEDSDSDSDVDSGTGSESESGSDPDSGPRYRDPEWLRARYRREGLTQREMAQRCGVSPSTVRKWMRRHGIDTRDLEGENHPLYGEERDDTVREQISETMTGREMSEETRKRMAESHEGTELSQETRERISEALEGRTLPEETRRKMSEATAGEANPNWRGGYSRRYGPGWATARDRVRERDGICQHCGHDGSHRRLEVHHIVPVREFRDATDAAVEDAHDEGNLVLLCRRCHRRADHGALGLESGVDRPE
jgi:5-methylcytosine-specific restriction endonuclease McrA